MESAERLRLSPEEWLDDLLGLFPDSEFTRDAFRLVPAAALPEPHRARLEHDHHMTLTLEEAYGAEVYLEVLDVRHAADDYARKLYLTAGERGLVVLVGIMRIWLQFARPEVRAAITAARTPLGRILINSGVMRRLKTLAFLEVRLDRGLDRLFGLEGRSTTHGRLAMIYCDGEPAVELLEIIRPER